MTTRPEKGDRVEGSPSNRGEPATESAAPESRTADILCTVPNCEAQAVLVLNGRPICRPHCEEFAKQASIIDGSFRDVLKDASDEPWPMIAGPRLGGLDVAVDANAPESVERP